MKFICMVKFVPDTSKFVFNFENNTVDRQNVRMIINPDDAKAIAFALKIKQQRPEVTVEAVSMGPMSVMRLAEDLIRMGVDKMTLISDSVFAGSDSYVTSKVLGTYLRKSDFDCILSGTHAVDGDTSHVPSQVAEFLDIPQMSNVSLVDEDSLTGEEAVFVVEEEDKKSTYKIELPGVLSFGKDCKYKLPYIKYENLNRDVKDQIKVISNIELGFEKNAVGLKGSLTKVNRTFIKEYKQKKHKVVTADENGITCVYNFLKENSYL